MGKESVRKKCRENNVAVCVRFVRVRQNREIKEMLMERYRYVFNTIQETGFEIPYCRSLAELNFVLTFKFNGNFF